MSALVYPKEMQRRISHATPSLPAMFLCQLNPLLPVHAMAWVIGISTLSATFDSTPASFAAELQMASNFALCFCFGRSFGRSFWCCSRALEALAFLLLQGSEGFLLKGFQSLCPGLMFSWLGQVIDLFTIARSSSNLLFSAISR